MESLKRTYVSAMHGFGAGLYGTGLLTQDGPFAGSDFARWVRSLFAIYDIEAMIRLDLPWWTFQATRMIERHLAMRPGARVFEYGAGASTVFLARRAGEVISVEHDPYWQQVVARKLEGYAGTSIQLVPAPVTSAPGSFWSQHPAWVGHDFTDYVKAIELQEGRFDLIVIDGRCRVQCLAAAISRVQPDGIILFDNAGRRRYRAALENCRLAQLPTSGLTACLPYSDPTMLLSPSPHVLTALGDA